MAKFADNKRSSASPNAVDLIELNFGHCFKPIYYFSRMFGFMPFTIVFDSDGKIQTARIRAMDILWFMITIVLYLSSALYFVIFSYHQTWPVKTIILINCTRLTYMMRKLFNIVSIGDILHNRFRLIEILKKINTFDEKESFHFIRFSILI